VGKEYVKSTPSSGHLKLASTTSMWAWARALSSGEVSLLSLPPRGIKNISNEIIENTRREPNGRATEGSRRT
jgi:hypothetical protein